MGGESSALMPIIMCGEDASCAHLNWSATGTIQRDCGTSLELCGVFRKYNVPIARTLFVRSEADKGEASDPAESKSAKLQSFRKLHRVVGRALTAAIEACVEENTVEEMREKFDEFLNLHGYTKASRLGYSIGIGYVPNWGEGTVSVRKGDRTVLVGGVKRDQYDPYDKLTTFARILQ